MANQHLSCLHSTGKMFLAGDYLQSVALIRGGRHAYFASPGGIHHSVLDGVTVQLHGLDLKPAGRVCPIVSVQPAAAEALVVYRLP